MAVTKIWPVKDSLSRVLAYCGNPEKTRFSDLEHVIRYASDEEKVTATEERLYAVTGINCKAETAFEEMRQVQERFGKTSGNVAYHAYQSFKTGEVTAEQCHRLGVELARKMWGCGSPVETSDCDSNQKHRPSRQARPMYQVLVASHYNTGTFHNHLILQPVSLWDGRKYDCSKREYYRMRRLSDEMCAREGLTVVNDPGKKTPRQIYFAEKNGEPTRYNLMREAIDYALSMSWDHNSFLNIMKAQGYFIYLSPNYKYATIRSVNATRGTRLYRLGEAYDRPAIIKRLNENREYDYANTRRRFDAFTESHTYEWVRYHPPGREYEYRKRFYFTDFGRESLVEIYATLFVLLLDITVEAVKLAYELLRDQSTVSPYVLAVQMKPKSPELKAAERFVDRHTRQLLLMAQEKFKTADDVREYIAQRELDIADMIKTRERRRNQLRNAKDPEEIAAYRRKRDACTAHLAKLRLQKETAQTILSDIPKVLHLLRAEQNVQRGLDPYEHAKGFRMRDARKENNALCK